ncbi:MAG: hypothetical protein MUP81_03365 [Dehalococcoidia bacterium]|nr:hypothetical protein [Dehalococcoidia bacterium]
MNQKKIDEIRAVLDLPAEEQWKKLDEIFPDDLHCCCSIPICIEGRKDLADLAFRLRDEAVKIDKDKWLEACCEVIGYMEQRECCPTCHKEYSKKYWDWNKESQPIHWIIAALIAKVLNAKDE